MKDMDFVKICKKGEKCIKMSRLMMGTDHVGSLNDTELSSLFDRTRELKINTYDTSPIYIFDIENRFGKWLSGQKDRSEIYTITKGGFPFDVGAGTYNSRLTGTKNEIVDKILEEIHWSTIHLNDITVYLMHRDDIYYKDYIQIKKKQTPVKTIFEALCDPKLKIRYHMIGVSNWKKNRVNKIRKLSKDPIFNSPYFSLLEMSKNVTIHSGGIQMFHDEAMDPNFEKGVKIMPYSPLGGFPIFNQGWDAAKEMALRIMNGETILNKDPRYWSHVYPAIFHDENKKRYDRLVKFTKKLNKKYQANFTLDQVANAYVMAHRRCDFVIIGPTSVDQLNRSVEALKISKLLKPKHLEYLYRGKSKKSKKH